MKENPLPRLLSAKREETGLEVELTRLIGLYSHPKASSFVGHIASFAANPVGGELKADPSEVIEMGYFTPDEIPVDLLVTHARRIFDAFSGVGGGVVWSQDIVVPFSPDTTRADIYRQRDEFGLSRRDFYFETLGKTNPYEAQELGPEKINSH